MSVFCFYGCDYFSGSLKAYSNLYSQNNSNLKSQKDHITEEEKKNYIRAKKMFDYFAIEPRLEQGYSDYINEIVIKSLEYPESYLKDIESKGFKGERIFRILFGNYVKPENFNLRPLSKITHDIIEQLRPDFLKYLEE